MSDLNEINTRENDTGISEEDFKKQQNVYSGISYESALDRMLKARDEVFTFAPVANNQCPKCKSVNIKPSADKQMVCNLCNHKWLATVSPPPTTTNQSVKKGKGKK